MQTQQPAHVVMPISLYNQIISYITNESVTKLTFSELNGFLTAIKTQTMPLVSSEGQQKEKKDATSK